MGCSPPPRRGARQRRRHMAWLAAAPAAAALFVPRMPARPQLFAAATPGRLFAAPAAPAAQPRLCAASAARRGPGRGERLRGAPSRGAARPTRPPRGGAPAGWSSSAPRCSASSSASCRARRPRPLLGRRARALWRAGLGRPLRGPAHRERCAGGAGPRPAGGGLPRWARGGSRRGAPAALPSHDAADRGRGDRGADPILRRWHRSQFYSLQLRLPLGLRLTKCQDPGPRCGAFVVEEVLPGGTGEASGAVLQGDILQSLSVVADNMDIGGGHGHEDRGFRLERRRRFRPLQAVHVRCHVHRHDGRSG
ncbi:unnamed protein product [Prorocentrum cordatum]|uniref:PDZ domain-containing protein n=1 Tax=Prorocentrum cordatum TaxID=2364126 RepID=A0ABN9QQE5_9DINO|nr:unnamed protein product [Polarella glacialis]